MLQAFTEDWPGFSTYYKYFYYDIVIFFQETEVSSVKYIHIDEYKDLLAKGDEEFVPYDVEGQYGQLFTIIEQR